MASKTTAAINMKSYRAAKSGSAFFRKNTLYFMAIPCILFVIIFSYLPLLGWSIAFFDYKPGLNLFQTPFVGLKYFILATHDLELLSVLRNTLIMSFLGLFCTPLPAVLAILLSEIRSKVFKQFIQTTTTFPNFISWVLVFSVFYALLSPNDGVVNKVLLSLHIIDQPIDPIGDDSMVYLFQTGIGLWKITGFSAIIYLATIAGIDSELYDAANVDGAGRFRRIIHVTVPGLYSTFFTLLVLSIGQMLNNGFEQYFLFYNDVVADKIKVLDLHLYQLGITFQNYSFSTAIGIAKTIVSVLLLTFANFLSKKIRGVSIL